MTDTPNHILDESTASAAFRWILPGVLAGLLTIAVFVGAWLWWNTQPPDTDSADAGFARDMTDHHAQAVEMALIAFERTEDPAIRQIAYDIATSQQAQIGMMTGWLNIWDLPSARAGPPMAWMDSDDMAGHDMEEGETISLEDMPGMLARDQIDGLRTLDPAGMDIEFLLLMIEHHEGGIVMAEAGVDLAEEDVVKRLANAIIISQSAEVTIMAAMLAEREGS